MELGRRYRRIEAETGVRRETVSRYDRIRLANAAKSFPGSTPRLRFTVAVYRTAIAEKLDAGLSLQRIWQDLVEEYGYGASYESVKRFVRTLTPTRRGRRRVSLRTGAEGQVDFFRGTPTLDAGTGELRPPWVFRMPLGHSRHGYEEAVGSANGWTNTATSSASAPACCGPTARTTRSSTSRWPGGTVAAAAAAAAAD